MAASVDRFGSAPLSDLEGSPVNVPTGRATTLSLLWVIPAAVIVVAALGTSGHGCGAVLWNDTRSRCSTPVRCHLFQPPDRVQTCAHA